MGTTEDRGAADAAALGAYLDAVAPANRVLFDRVRAEVEQRYPAATLGWSYKMPTFSLGKRRLYVGAWAHGLSLYGWRQGGEAGVVVRHPAIKTSKGTIRLRPEDAAELSDAELGELVDAALGA